MPYRLGMPARKWPTPQDASTARRVLLDGTARDTGHRSWQAAARPDSNHTVIIEFLVDDVDGVHQNLAGFVEDFVTEPNSSDRLPQGG